MKKQFVLIVFAVLVFSMAIQAQRNVEESNFAQSVMGQTVLLGTYMWDADANSFPDYRTSKGRKADIWWQQVNNVKQNLVPSNGALIIQVHDREFATITAEDLKILRYSSKPISNEVLVPGAIIAIRTAEGNFAKLKIVGYRSLQDFSFKEAEILREGWKSMVESRPYQENYHLEVEWVLFTNHKIKLYDL